VSITQDHIQVTIKGIKEEILKLERQIEQSTDPREKRKLKRQLKYQQNLRLWHLGKLG